MPPAFQLPNRINVTAIEGMCMLLRRLAYPNRLSDLVKVFHRDETSISRIFNYMIEWLFINYALPKLQFLHQPYLTRQILQELADVTSAAGSYYPNVVGFIDGSVRQICRPKYNQNQMYSGYKKKHIAKYQSIVLSNGLIGRLDGPFIGKRHDADIVHLSKITIEMQRVLVNPDGTHYIIYGDPGYSNQKLIKVGFKNHQTLNQRQKDFNKTMSELRVGVEYGFGKIVQEFAFLDFVKTQRLYLMPLKKMYYVAALLVNCQSCLRGGNQVSDIFESTPPTLQEYLKK